MYKHFISRRLEGQAKFRRGRGPAGLFGGSWTAPGQGERGWWVIHGHWEGYGRLAVAGFRTDGYPQAVRWLWTSGTRCGVIRLGGRRGCRRGRARGSNGSRALQASLARCLRIRSTTRGSVMKETIFICAPQVHRRGSTSKILRSKRAQEALRARLESIFSSSLFCCIPDGRQLWPSSPAIVTRARFDRAP